MTTPGNVRLLWFANEPPTRLALDGLCLRQIPLAVSQTARLSIAIADRQAFLFFPITGVKLSADLAFSAVNHLRLSILANLR